MKSPRSHSSLAPAINSLTAGANGLANFAGDITYKGTLAGVDGRVRLAAQQSRMATITANRTRLAGGYHLGIRAGTQAHRFVGIWAVVVEVRVFVRSWSLKPRSSLKEPRATA